MAIQFADGDKGSPAYDKMLEETPAFQLEPNRLDSAKALMKELGSSDEARVTFSSGPLKVFGNLFNHPYPLDLSIIKQCFQGCSYCFAVLNKLANKDTVGDMKDPTDLVIKKMQKAHSPAYDSESLIEFCIHERYPIVFSNNVDPFLPLSEQGYKLGERILKAALELQQPLFIQTKEVFPNDTVRDLIVEGRDIFGVYVTITSTDDRIAAKFEGGAPRPSERFRRIKELADRGVKVTVAINPYIAEWQPNIREYMKMCADHGAVGVYADPLHFTRTQAKVAPKHFRPYAEKSNRWVDFFEDALLLEAAAKEFGLKFYRQARLPDSFYNGNAAELDQWPIDAHHFAEYLYSLWAETKTPIIFGWDDVNAFYEKFAPVAWNNIIKTSELAGVMWYSNETYKEVNGALGKRNAIKNVVRFLHNKPHLYENWMFYYDEVQVLLEKDGNELTPLYGEQGDLTYVFDPTVPFGQKAQDVDEVSAKDGAAIDWED